MTQTFQKSRYIHKVTNLDSISHIVMEGGGAGDLLSACQSVTNIIYSFLH